MERTFERTKFFDGVSYLFSRFFEYFKLFLMTILNTIAITIIGLVPFIGWIASLILSVLTIMFIPFGVVDIVCGIKIDFTIYQDFFDFLPRAFSKPVIIQVVKILLIGVAVILIYFILIAGSFGSNNLNAVVVSSLSIIPLVLIALIAETKMMVTLTLLIISMVYEDYEVEFYNTQKGQYKCMFLWVYVPIINIIATYVFATIFAKDIKEYYEL